MAQHTNRPIGFIIDEENYTSGSAAAPPPSYEDVTRLGVGNLNMADTTVGKTEQELKQEVEQQAPPLGPSVATADQRGMSSIDEYKDTMMYSMLVLVKKIYDQATKEADYLTTDPSSKDLFSKFSDLQFSKDKIDAGSVLHQLGGTVHHRAKVLAVLGENFDGVLPQVLFDVDYGRRLQRHYNLSRFEGEINQMISFHDNVDKLRTWTDRQLQLEAEWTDQKRSRVPHLENEEAETLKNALERLTRALDRIHGFRRTEGFQYRLQDYYTESMVAIKIRELWSFLVRIVEYEMREMKDSDSDAEPKMSLSPTEFGDAPIWQPPPPPPFSKVCDFQQNRLYPILLNVKDLIDKIMKGIPQMKEAIHMEVVNMSSNELKELKAEALQRIMHSDTEWVDEPVTQANESWCGGDRKSDQDKQEARVRLHKLHVDYRTDIAKLLTWMRPQQKLDKEWRHGEARVPILTTPEKVQMSKTFMSLSNRWTDMVQGFRNPLNGFFFYDKYDYAEDLAVKGELKSLWSLLTRIADWELNKVDYACSDVVGGPENRSQHPKFATAVGEKKLSETIEIFH